MQRTLVIPDPHTDPAHSNERFTAAGNFCLEHQFDNVVNIGDWLSLDSVSFHDYDKPLIREGKRLRDDLDAGADALDKFEAPINEYNSRRSVFKKRLYKPFKVWCNANHEERFWRYVMTKPELMGLLNHNDLLGVQDRGWNILPFRQYAFIEGVGFTHIPMNKRNNNPIGGEYVAKRAAEQQMQSVVFGHTHRLLLHDKSFVGMTNHGPIHAMSVGWFGDYIPDYVEGNEDQLDWWSGLVVINHYAPFKMDIETISMERLKQQYL